MENTETTLVQTEQPQLPPSRILGRLTVVDKVYFQQGSEQPYLVNQSFGQVAEFDDEMKEAQPFRRNFKVGEIARVPLGWMEDQNLGMLCIQNLSKDHSAILVYSGVDVAKILPGSSIRFCPIDSSQVEIFSSSNEKISMTVTAFPEVIHG